jgi:SseB protein C-terminal domain/SseB protein N-terminal domain
MADTANDSLAVLLRRAADEPAARPAFYEALLAATIFVIGSTGDDAASGEQVLTAGSKIQLQNWSKPDGSFVIPLFTSLDALRKAVDNEVGYLALPARGLFEITAGAVLVLDPGADYGKEFHPDEIQQLLATGLAQVAQSRVVQQDTQVLLGQPSQRPEAMLTSLGRLFATRPSVVRAYLALMHDPTVDEAPHLLVGIDIEGDHERVFQEAGNVVADQAARTGPIDFIRVRAGDDGVARYFIDDCRPFYERAASTAEAAEATAQPVAGEKPGFFASLFGKRPR